MNEVKSQVQQFYNEIGWQQSSEGFYQNTRYEDLRPVSREYIHNCHLRVTRHLKPQGRILLDAGSGPIQYPEYLEYSEYYRYRVCVDLSFVALQEARKRVGHHGLCVVADVTNLPFKENAFDGIISLHTFHHLPPGGQPRAYQELYRVLAPECTAVVVNGWNTPPLSQILELPLQLRRGLRRLYRSMKNKLIHNAQDAAPPKATFVHKNSALQLKNDLGQDFPMEIWVWRSISVRFLRTFIHAHLGGRMFLRILYQLEERFPHFFGIYGQYPLIVVTKNRQATGKQLTVKPGSVIGYE